MYFFGSTSADRLASCHDDIRLVGEAAIRRTPIDFFIVCGHRKRIEQETAFREGNSKVKWPDSRHNRFPSEAFDFAPVENPWGNSHKALARYYFLAGVFWSVASEVGVQVRWGGNWDSDGDFADQTFDDLGHIEIVSPNRETRKV